MSQRDLATDKRETCLNHAMATASYSISELAIPKCIGRCTYSGLSIRMEQASFQQLGKNIISLVERAAVGKWPEAEALQKKAMNQVMVVMEENPQKDRPKMKKRFDECSCCCGNLLASVLTCQGRWQQAEILLRELWHVAQVTLPDGNPDVLNSIENLADVLQSEGNMQESEKINRIAVRICWRGFGKYHTYTLTSKNNLANVLREQGKWQQAEEMHKEVLEVRRKALGESHLDTLASMNNLALVIQKQIKWHGADKWQEGEKWQGAEKWQGEPQGAEKWQEAQKLHREVLGARRKALGESHLDTLASMNNLANVLQKQGQWQEAEDLHREVLEIRRQILGEEHPDTLSSMTNYASVLLERDAQDWQFRYSLTPASHAERVTDALDKLRRAIETLNPRVDDDHPQLLRQKFALAKLLLQINHKSSLQEAENLLLQLYPALQKRYGLRHPRTQEATGDLVFLLEERGKDAEEWRQHLIQIENDIDSSALPCADENLSREDWEGCEELTELLRDLLEGKLVRARTVCHAIASASSAPSSSAASKIPTLRDEAVDRSELLSLSMASAGYEPSDDASTEFFQAALQEKLQERIERGRGDF